MESLLRLAVMGDLHYHDADEAVPVWRNARDAYFEELIDAFLGMEADVHISLGDLTNYGTRSELEGVYGLIRRHDRRFIHVLGNHDLYAQPRLGLLETTGGQRYHVLESDEAVLAFLDTAKEMDLTDDHPGSLRVRALSIPG